MIDSLRDMPETAPSFCRVLWRVFVRHTHQPIIYGKPAFPLCQIGWAELLEEVAGEAESPRVDEATIKRALIWYVAFNMIAEVADRSVPGQAPDLQIAFLPSSEWSPALWDHEFTSDWSPLDMRGAKESMELQLAVNAWEQARGYDRLAESEVFQANSQSPRDPRRMC